MAVKGCKTIAEYAIRKWLQDREFVMNYFKLQMFGNSGTLTDRNGETLTLVYEDGEVRVVEGGE